MTVREAIAQLSTYEQGLVLVGVNEETGDTVKVYGFYIYKGKVYVDLEGVPF